MPRKSLSQSVCASAAASVVACTAGLTSESAEAAPIWIDAPHLEGTYQPEGLSDFSFDLGDFDQDGLGDFNFFYYTFGEFAQFPAFMSQASGRFFNPAADIFYSSASQYEDSGYWNIVPEAFGSRDDVYVAGQNYELLPRPLIQISSSSIADVYDTRSFFGGTFFGGDGKMYIAYLEIEAYAVPDYTQSYLTVYDAGYALIPEPSSLALLGLGGLLLGRRRRA